MKLGMAALCAGIIVIANPVRADILIIRIDPGSLPYGLGPSKYDNSPSKYDNSASKYDNSASKYDNSASKYENSSSNYANGPSGSRRLLMQDNKMIGYYVISSDGVLNFYNRQGRVAYMPAGDGTRSLFFSETSAWCGTFGEVNGQTAIGLTQGCLLRFMLDQ
jgi:hypothetical protein